MNAFICIDLYLSVRSPFTPGGRRLPYYLNFTGLILLITLSFGRGFLPDSKQIFEEYRIPLLLSYDKLNETLVNQTTQWWESI